jgi:hypothetical protein
MILFESPVTFVPLKVRVAKATPALARRRTTAAETILPTENFFMVIVLSWFQYNRL